MEDIKKCPVCKTTLFGDMDTCYGCMYKFGSHPEIEAKSVSVPELAAAFEWATPETGFRKTSNGSAPVEETLAASLFGMKNEGSCLFNKFLVEFHSFLGEFLVDRNVDVN